MKRHAVVAIVVSLTLSVAATVVLATSPYGFIAAAILARGTLTTPVKAHADRIALRTKEPIDHVVQHIVWGAGSSSGWHVHPGVVLVTVKSGSVVFYESDCSRQTFTAGQTFFESGKRAGLVRNETSSDAEVYATYIIPAGAPLRIDMPNPGCSVE